MIECAIATREDAPALAALAAEIWTEHYTPLVGPLQVRYMLERFQSEEAIAADIAATTRYVIAREEGVPVGYLALRPEEGYLFLSKIYVRRDCRGKGIGGRFFGEALAYARELALPAIRLTVNKGNTDSIAIYRHRGFEVIDAVVADIGKGYVMDDFIMEMKVGEG